MKTSEAVSLLKHLIKTSKLNTEVLWNTSNESAVFFEHLLTLQRFSKQRSSPAFIVKNTYARGRSYRGLFMISANSGYHIPVTQQMLRSAEAPPLITNRRAAILSQMRELIQYQIDEARARLKAEQGGRCALTGKYLASGQNHVDHFGSYPFIRISDEWLASQGLTKYEEADFKNEEVCESWKEWHLKHADLRLTLAKANVSKGASGYKSKF